ncbi:MAG: hypothetical protein JRG89_02075 [Deltaproteobacteria bacterium]|nr:hypothetical protein [Deltaproteobacteria bacterium]MBW2387199.1 hypothetical protein [Deltaproteobacteria bacterium]MBW2725904.1 hypothetical protein [Deltaproteobacteria bacterium]
MRAKQDVRPTSPTPGSEPAAAASHGSGPGWPIVVLLFVSLLGVYHANSALTHINDITPNVATAISLVDEGNPTFTPDEFPRLFLWSFDIGGRSEPITLSSWQQLVNGVPAGERFAKGEISFSGHPYHLIASIREGEYVSRYGLGAAITALPVFAVLDAIVGDLQSHWLLSLYAGKFVAACCVAGSAVFILLIASIYLPRSRALLVALTYGLGSSVWSTSSQGLWQHGPAELYLAMACWLFIRGRVGTRDAAICGLAVAMATLCRPTSAALALALGAALLVSRDYRRLVAFVAAGSVIGLVAMAHNFVHSGSILGFAQSMEAADYALSKTGVASAWQFNIAQNAAGLLFSPSRGLFVFSPVMLFAVAGLVPAWRDPRYLALRPISLALALTLSIQLCWFDWWGGWSYGYRILVDAMVYLVLFLIPFMGWIWARRSAVACFHLALAWSIFVQALGAFAANGWSWNNRTVYRLEVDGRVQGFYDAARAKSLLDTGRATFIDQKECSVDLPECRNRLWSIRDNQIGYYVEHYREEREQKRSVSAFKRSL